jgi:hypothetical protein
MHSVLFDHHLERDGDELLCDAIQVCFDTHAQRCQSQFSSRQLAFMNVMCLSSALHGSHSTIASARTRGLTQLLFLRLWPMSAHENAVVVNVKNAMSELGLKARLSVYMRVAANTSIMELVAWAGLVLYAHTVLSNGAVVSTWNGAYDEMLRVSNFTTWNVSRGQDPRYTVDLLYLMSNMLLVSLACCSVFPVPISASLIVLAPVMVIIQVRFWCCFVCCCTNSRALHCSRGCGCCCYCRSMW